jgi:hypothetical protein
MRGIAFRACLRSHNTHVFRAIFFVSPYLFPVWPSYIDALILSMFFNPKEGNVYIKHDFSFYHYPKISHPLINLFKRATSSALSR